MEANNIQPVQKQPVTVVKQINPVAALSFHGNEIEEIVSKQPPFFVRWGTVFFLFFLLFLGFLCWFIQYPDIVSAGARLSSINPPREIKAKQDGKIQDVLVKNGDTVRAGDPLAYMETIAEMKSVQYVKDRTDSVLRLLEQKNEPAVVNLLSTATEPGLLNRLGELQADYQVYMQSYFVFRDFVSNGFFLRKKNMLYNDLSNMQRQHAILKEQKGLLSQDLSLAGQNYKANEALKTEKVISEFDYRSEKSKLIAKQLTIPGVNNEIVMNESQQNEKRKEIAELDNKIGSERQLFIQAAQTFRSRIGQWEHNYVFKAPVNGLVSFAFFLQNNQQVRNGQLLFFVKPPNTSYYVEMLIPQFNLGKVNAGQDVLLKFLAYPSEQFGTIKGKIDFVSTTPADSGFMAKIILPQGLVTNYNRQLVFRDGLFARAEIITERMNLLQRFYNRLRKPFY